MNGGVQRAVLKLLDCAYIKRIKKLQHRQMKKRYWNLQRKTIIQHSAKVVKLPHSNKLRSDKYVGINVSSNNDCNNGRMEFY